MLECPAEELPEVLAELQMAHRPGDLVEVDLAGLIAPQLADLIIEGAGFERARAHNGNKRLRRLHTLPDRVGPNMKILVCGLNPSPASAESGIAFHKPGNRFWPAAIAAGLASVDRDPAHALARHGMGMTDIVKRTTRRAEEIGTDEFRAGMNRVVALVEWLEPAATVMVGLGGWRAVVDRTAQRGWQPGNLGGSPVYVMPSTSGLNAHDTVDTLTEHFRRALIPQPSRAR